MEQWTENLPIAVEASSGRQQPQPKCAREQRIEGMPRSTIGAAAASRCEFQIRSAQRKHTPDALQRFSFACFLGQVNLWHF